MIRFLRLTALVSMCCVASGQQQGASDRDARAWRYSLIPVAVTSATDIVSSRGLVELNPVIGTGEFGGRQVTAKLIGVGVLVGIEYLAIRKWPRSARLFRNLNFGYAGVTAGVSVQNWRQR